MVNIANGSSRLDAGIAIDGKDLLKPEGCRKQALVIAETNVNFKLRVGDLLQKKIMNLRRGGWVETIGQRFQRLGPN